MITAQQLYDAREEFGSIGGDDLHSIFYGVLGDPSPAGRTEINPERLWEYAQSLRDLQSRHYANSGVGGTYLEDIALFCEQWCAPERAHH